MFLVSLTWQSVFAAALLPPLAFDWPALTLWMPAPSAESCWRIEWPPGGCQASLVTITIFFCLPLVVWS